VPCVATCIVGFCGGASAILLSRTARSRRLAGLPARRVFRATHATSPMMTTPSCLNFILAPQKHRATPCTMCGSRASPSLYQHPNAFTPHREATCRSSLVWCRLLCSFRCHRDASELGSNTQTHDDERDDISRHQDPDQIFSIISLDLPAWIFTIIVIIIVVSTNSRLPNDQHHASERPKRWC
jgi:hypothetical protein